jgi:uncharacterized damage-inducible protein DinB
MTTSAEILVDGFERIRGVVRRALAGLTEEQLTYQVDGEANSIAWLVWHLTRVQDDHIAEVAGIEQVWTAGRWADRFGLPFPPEATGYGHSTEEVQAVRRIPAADLSAYHDAVTDQTVRYVEALTDDDLDRIVDTSWDPPVTLAVRLVSVIGDDLQHAGQASFVRGVLGRRG